MHCVVVIYNYYSLMLMKKLILLLCIFISLVFFPVSAQEEHLELIKKQWEIINHTRVETIENISRSTMNTELLIKNFCESLHTFTLSYKQIEHQIYDARQSLFVYFLCESWWAKREIFSKKFSKDGYLKNDMIKSLDIIPSRKIKSDCNPNQTDMNSCEIHFYYPKLMQALLNDYFNIKQLQVFWIQDIQGEYEKKANHFSEQYFTQLKICESEDYKKTCNILKDFIKNAETTAEHTKIIDVKKLSESNSDCSDIYSKNYDLLYCGLLWDSIYSDLSFNNILYNELFRYMLFLDYYSSQIEDAPHKYLSLQEQEKNITVQKTLVQHKISTYKNMSTTIKQALRISLQKIQDIKNTLPLHIWLLMYQEDLASIRKAMGNMYSPIRTLFDKLRNVQDANS